MHRKLMFTLTVLLLTGLLASSAVAADTQRIKGPNGHLLSKAMIIEAYQHVADTRAFLDAMLKYGPRKLVYHSETSKLITGWDIDIFEPNHWKLRYEYEQEMAYESRNAEKNALNWRAMLLQYLPPYIGENNYTFSWRSDGIWQQGNEDIAFVYKTFDDGAVEDALDAMNKITDILENDLGKPDDDQGDKAGETLKERINKAREYLRALLRKSPPGGVKLPQIKGKIRSDFAEMINEKQPGTVDNSDVQQRETTVANANSDSDGGPASRGVLGADGEGSRTNSISLFGQTADSANSRSNAAGSTTNNNRAAVTDFENREQAVSHTGTGGAATSEATQAYIPLSLLQAGVPIDKIPGPEDTAAMNSLLNSIGANANYPNTQMNTGVVNAQTSGFTASNQGGYVAVIEGMGPLLIVQLSEADKKLLEDRDALRQTFVRDLQNAGMSQQQASQQADKIMEGLLAYSGTSNALYSQGSGNNTASNNTVNNNTVSNNTVNNNTVNNNTGNNTAANNAGSSGNTTMTANQRAELKQATAKDMAQLNKYFNQAYPPASFIHAHPENIQKFFASKKKDDSSVTYLQAFAQDTSNIANASQKAHYVALLGKDHRDVVALNSATAKLDKLYQAYAQASPEQQLQIIDEMKRTVITIQTQLNKVHAAASAV